MRTGQRGPERHRQDLEARRGAVTAGATVDAGTEAGLGRAGTARMPHITSLRDATA